MGRHLNSVSGFLLLAMFLMIPLLGHTPVQSADDTKALEKFEIKGHRAFHLV